MKIYIVSQDAWDDERTFDEIPDSEIEQMPRDYVDCFDSIEALAAAWRTGEVFQPEDSYMRVIG